MSEKLSNYSDTTKYNLLHTLREMKELEDKEGYCPTFADSWDEWDLEYLIKLVERDI